MGIILWRGAAASAPAGTVLLVAVTPAAGRGGVGRRCARWHVSGLRRSWRPGPAGGARAGGGAGRGGGAPRAVPWGVGAVPGRSVPGRGGPARPEASATQGTECSVHVCARAGG